ncbi:unnamed protein product [Brachionus calyciflorus]|uniref:Endoglycoceramidase n=1 Tax=Brachionus calyciflorus TaxID=104777 RepID=A0A813SCK1_9BILA|nr:unnamed protein product [Brachionus calyciflorus]
MIYSSNKTFYAFLFIIFSIKIVHIELSSLPRIKIKGKWFVDQDDRVVLFHGINAVKKEFPWIPDSTNLNLTNETQLNFMKNWGFNSARVGIMWSGLYPEKGKLNLTYVNEMKKIVNLLEKYGIYVIIDLHQDMMSSKFAAYDGFPLWFLNELPSSKFPFPWPLTNKSIEANVFAAYITEACSFAFQCLYDNVNKVQEYFFEYWRTVAQLFSNSTSILAYEIINEPWAGNIFQNPFLLLPGIADKVNLLPLYDKTYEEIRNYDKETIVFYEPVTWGLVSSKDVIGTGFDHAPGNDTSGTALSWHFYCWLLDLDPNLSINGTFPDYVRQICNDWQLNAFFKAVDDESKKLGGSASFLTEFGICIFRDSKTGKLNLDACKYVLDASDEHFQSWTYWESNFFSNDQSFNEELLNIFSRVYPVVTNGIPKSLNYNSTTKNFLYTYEMTVSNYKQALLTTEIHVPQFLYKYGFQVNISPDLKWFYDSESSRIIISLNDTYLNKFSKEKNFKFQAELNVNIFSK